MKLLSRRPSGSGGQGTRRRPVARSRVASAGGERRRRSALGKRRREQEPAARVAGDRAAAWPGWSRCEPAPGAVAGARDERGDVAFAGVAAGEQHREQHERGGEMDDRDGEAGAAHRGGAGEQRSRAAPMRTIRPRLIAADATGAGRGGPSSLRAGRRAQRVSRGPGATGSGPATARRPGPDARAGSGPSSASRSGSDADGRADGCSPRRRSRRLGPVDPPDDDDHGRHVGEALLHRKARDVAEDHHRPRVRHRAGGRSGFTASVRRSTPSAVPMSTSCTIAGGKRPCSTTPGVADSRCASRAGSPNVADIVGDEIAIGALRHVAQRAGSHRASVFAAPKRRISSGTGWRSSRTRLVRRDDDDEAARRRRDDLLAGVRGSAALDEPAVRGHLVGAVDRDVQLAELVERFHAQPELDRAAFSVAREVAAQRSVRPRAASAGSRWATVLPVPRPTRSPSATSRAAASAAARFCASVSLDMVSGGAGGAGPRDNTAPRRAAISERARPARLSVMASTRVAEMPPITFGDDLQVGAQVPGAAQELRGARAQWRRRCRPDVRPGSRGARRRA